MSSIYGPYEASLPKVMAMVADMIRDCSGRYSEEHGAPLYEHLIYRIKSDTSMREKLQKRGLPETSRAALKELTDSIGLRVVCRFIDDIYTLVEEIRAFPDCRIVEEKDYIRAAKPNGYRSLHMILEVTAPFEDPEGNDPGKFYAEIQIRTIAMDTWAALEHDLKYKQEIQNPELIAEELRRCANELAACDVSMQTLRKLIREQS